MFNIWHYVTHDEVRINPVDLMGEKMSAANRLYLSGVEMLRRREENMRLKRLQEERDVARELQTKPSMNQTSKDILFKNNHNLHGKDFFEYNMDWKLRVDKKLENERKAKEEIQKLEAEEEQQRIKDFRQQYLKSKSHQRLTTPPKDAGSKERRQKVHTHHCDADKPSTRALPDRLPTSNLRLREEPQARRQGRGAPAARPDGEGVAGGGEEAQRTRERNPCERSRAHTSRAHEERRHVQEVYLSLTQR